MRYMRQGTDGWQFGVTFEQEDQEAILSESSQCDNQRERSTGKEKSLRKMPQDIIQTEMRFPNNMGISAVPKGPFLF